MTIKNFSFFFSGLLVALALTYFAPRPPALSGSHALALFGAAQPAESGKTGESAPPGIAPSGTAAGFSPSEARRTAIVVAAEKVSPAVVSITIRRSAVVAYGNPFFQDPFFEFFGPQYRRKEMSSLGSGVIVSKEGFILTNSHVVGSAEGGQLEAITVTLADGKQYEAKVVGQDNASDLAVLRIKGAGLPVAPMQEKPDNLIGEWVVAIGNPYGYLIGDTKPTVTVGVIGAVNRTFSSNSDIHYHNMIQTDASINPGNSGGALVNVEGKVIGINTFILTGGGQSQGSIGLGFAIPIQKARQVMDELIRYGYIREFTTGIYTDPALNEGRPGVVVAGLDRNSPGEKAGLRVGDIIYSVADKRINTFQDIQDIFKLFQVGDAVEILYLRGKDKLKTRMVLEEMVKKRKIF